MESSSGNKDDSQMKQFPYIKACCQCSLEERLEAFETAEKLIRYARIAQQKGILFMEEHLKGEEDRFLKEGLSQVMDGVAPEALKEYLISYILIAGLMGRRFLEMMMIADGILKIQANVNPKHMILRFADLFGSEFLPAFQAVIRDLDNEDWEKAQRFQYQAYRYGGLPLAVSG